MRGIEILIVVLLGVVLYVLLRPRDPREPANVMVRMGAHGAAFDYSPTGNGGRGCD